MTKERPIIFSTAMVQALLNGNKTQTRRVAKNIPDTYQAEELEKIKNHSASYFHAQCPYGKPGDLLWVRETFRYCKLENLDYMYKAFMDEGWGFKWKPSIHMPKAAARIWLQITEVRVEPLQLITIKEAIAEGVEVIGETISDKPLYRDYTKKESWIATGETNPILSFKGLWGKIHGPESWQQNPYVWVVKFNVVSTTGKPEFSPKMQSRI